MDQELGVCLQESPGVLVDLFTFLGVEFVDEGAELVGRGFVVAFGDTFFGCFEFDIEAVDDALICYPAITWH